MNEIATPSYQTSADAALNFTASAARKVRELIDEEQNPALKLRVYIQGGGCSGFQYGFSFEEAAEEDDLAVERVIRNPNAKTTCGCGSSFTA